MIKKFIAGNRYLKEEETINNAEIIYSYFVRDHGWTVNACAGMLGNMEHESGVNPGIWQNLTPFPDDPIQSGYGLIQWTPYTVYADWAGSGWENNGLKQCDRIWWEVLHEGAAWIQTSRFPVSFKDFIKSTDSPSLCAEIFYFNRERGPTENFNTQPQLAEKWYEYLTGKPFVDYGYKMPIWLLAYIGSRGYR